MRVGRAALATAVFAAALVATFPTDALVRRALARALPPGGPRVEFDHATLRPWGLRLAPLTLRDAAGYRLATADTVMAHPSLLGLLHDGTGRPWRASAVAYGGTVTALVDRAGVDLEWHDLDLARVPGLALAGERPAGRADGAARLVLPPASADGTLGLRAATWPAAARILVGAETMPIDATLRWRLAGGRLELDDVAGHGAGVDVAGGGSVRLASPVGRSVLDLRLLLSPGVDTAPRLRGLIDALPAGGRDDVRRLVLVGTLDGPRVESAP
jgi:type II secretion system protein N